VQQPKIKKSTQSREEAISVFFGEILPVHTIVSDEEEARKSLQEMASTKDPEHLFRTAMLDDLKGAIIATVSTWNDDQAITDYLVGNVDGAGYPSCWATFETQSPNPEHKIQRMGGFVIGATRRRVINVWRTQCEYWAWSGFPWPTASQKPARSGETPAKRWWKIW